jgi:carboxymethylenebutenolidase
MTGIRKASLRLFVCLAILAVVVYPSVSLTAERQEVKVPVGESHELGGVLFVPSAPGPAPAVLVLHTRGGLLQADVSYAEELARAGFVSLAVSYYPNPKYDALLLQHPGYIEELARVVDYLQARPEVQGKPVGVVGFSLGSKGISVAARHSGVKAVVSYYGVYDLRILPQAKGVSRYPPMPVDVAAQVGAPVLLLHGAQDDETPLSQAESMRDALVKAGKVVELVVYPQATHAFDRGFGRGLTDRTREGYTYRLDQYAKQDAWNRTLAWFRKYLAQ